MHFAFLAISRALLKAGNNIAAKIAIIAITTNSSIKVKPFLLFVLPSVLSIDIYLTTSSGYGQRLDKILLEANLKVWIGEDTNQEWERVKIGTALPF